MDKRTVLDAVAGSGEERVLLSRIWDKYEQCRRRNLPVCTAFLSPQERSAAQRLLSAIGVNEGYVFFGGYDGAERCQLHFLPDWAWAAEEDSLCAVRCTWYAGQTLTHRDLLGSLMGLGITRESIGDILVDSDSADVLVSAGVADFLLQSWSEAGRVHLRTEQIPLDHLHIPQRRVRVIRDTVSSLRLDSVTAAAFSLSRGKAAEAISAGRVQLNWSVCVKGDHAVTGGDSISLRGLGKCTIEEIGKGTKKSRIFITINRYL